MGMISRIIFGSYLLLGTTVQLYAGDKSPWGVADVLDIEYEPQRVVYDSTTGDKNKLSRVLDRIVYLYKLYQSDPLGSSIVVVIHGDAIPYFAIEEFSQNEETMRRAQSLTVGTSIEFRMCRAAAKLLNYEAKDIHGFVKMVPMADAEIVRLQDDGYDYLH
jgi:hypothetical protein